MIIHYRSLNGTSWRDHKIPYILAKQIIKTGWMIRAKFLNIYSNFHSNLTKHPDLQPNDNIRYYVNKKWKYSTHYQNHYSSCRPSWMN